MSFIQVIEFRTNRLAELEEVMQGWVEATEGKRKAQRANLTADRDRPNTYVQIVEFPSYEDAMANSQLPETSAFAQKLMALCDGEPKFLNLDVRQTFDL